MSASRVPTGCKDSDTRLIRVSSSISKTQFCCPMMMNQSLNGDAQSCNEKLGGCWEEWRLLLPSPALEMVQGLHLGDMSGTRCLGRALTESMKCSGSRASVLWKFVSRRGVWAALICLVGWPCDAGCAAGQWGGLGCFGRPNPTFPTQQESFPLVNRLQ